jgi:PleD family two-component response regulator
VGEEEFAVLLPQSALEAACTIGGRVRAAVAGSAFEAGLGRFDRKQLSKAVRCFA